MWPALLMSAGLPPPQRVFGHGFLTKDGLKMGKALGNVLDPAALVATYGADAVRFFFMKEIRFGQVVLFASPHWTCMLDNLQRIHLLVSHEYVKHGTQSLFQTCICVRLTYLYSTQSFAVHAVEV